MFCRLSACWFFCSPRCCLNTARGLLAFLLFAAMASCVDSSILVDDVLGEWEKEDNSLPPIHIVLSRDGTRILARIRLSGVDLNGMATLDGNQLLMRFDGREEITGTFSSRNLLNLRLGERDVLLVKRR